MEKMNRTISDQTGSLIKALEYALKAKEEIYTSLTGAYGEEQGDKMFIKDYDEKVESLLSVIKKGIGDSMELNMSYLNDNLL